MAESGKEIFKTPVDSSVPWAALPGPGLFLASFLSLFLELLLIRWIPSQIPIVAYYSNLMLISAFLGLGCGILLARRELGLYRWFGPLLLPLMVFVPMMQGVAFKQGPDELRFFVDVSTSTTTVPIVVIFVMNTLVFVPLGDLIGSYFQRMPPLLAYSWDLGGAMAGTLLFGLFSYFWFSPILGCLIVMTVYLIYCRGILQLIFTGLFFVSSLSIMVAGADEPAIWSPYNYITVVEQDSDGRVRLVSTPAENIGALQDPPSYTILKNRITYMWTGTIDSRRYTAPGQYQLNILGIYKMPLINIAELYSLPHLIRPEAKRVLVVGSGAGIDVEAALLFGAERVDAVEIDPVIIQMGHQFSASQSYKNPGVSIHNTDARAFFKQTDKTYDMVVFGFLDSISLFSQMSSIRLDGYVYTRESFREAFSLLKEGGLLSVSFFAAGQLWLLDRLVAMVHSATNTVPLVYVEPSRVVILAGKGYQPRGPARFIGYRKIAWMPSGTPEATDDWPYLYLRRRFIPSDYLINIGALLAISMVLVFFSSGQTRKGLDLHFFFLGAGFLLLETKSIITISLYFGTTWFVAMIVILGVLMMVFLANLAASKLRQFSLVLYLPLIASVAFLYFFPTQTVLAWSFGSRLIYSLVIIPLPIFFAGLIFSSTFRESKDPSFSFGSNLLGAMVGGFAEYLGMITGTKALLLVILVFYLASVLVRLRTNQVLPARA